MPSLHRVDVIEISDCGWVEVLVDRIRSFRLTEIVLDKDNVPCPIPLDMKKRSRSHRSYAVADDGILKFSSCGTVTFHVETGPSRNTAGPFLAFRKLGHRVSIRCRIS